MKRLTWLLLALAVAFLGSSFADRCLEGDECGGCPPACHLACADGCAVAPVAAAAPSLAPLARCGEPPAEGAKAPLELDFPPDPFPPRA